MTDPVPSPCIKVCTLDTSGRTCLGCFRTIEEIGLWAQLSDAARAGIVAQLAGRRRLHEAESLARCQACGVAFHCGAQDAAQPCWCTAYPPVAPSGEDARCLCPACLAAAS